MKEKIDGSQAVEYIKAQDSMYYFDVGELEYTVNFDSDGEDASVIFSASGESTEDQKIYNQIDVGFKNAIVVFHTVYLIVEDFLESNDISILEFSAKSNEPSRVKFYRTLARQLVISHGYSADSVEETKKYDASALTFLIPVKK